MARALGILRQLAAAVAGHRIPLDGMAVEVPGPLPIRISVVAGNLRVQQLIDECVGAGGTVIDVGANTGYNTMHAAHRVGASGRVIAVEPAADNLAVLARNVQANQLTQVTVARVAAGRARGEREFYVRGDISAVNSFYPTSVYAGVTSVVRVPVVPVDELVDDEMDLAKIDVEGAELEVLGGMSRLLASPRLKLIIEWHPALQEAAGLAAEALPHELLRLGFTLEAIGHASRAPLPPSGVAAMAATLRRRGRPVELFARR